MSNGIPMVSFGFSNILKKPKDKIEKETSRGIVYKIKCKDCDCVYIGQTPHALKTRVKEHAKAIATLDENSLFAKHHMRHSHQVHLASVKIVAGHRHQATETYS